MRASLLYSVWLLMGAILLWSGVTFAQPVFQSLKWNNRVLVLHAPEGSTDIDEQVALLEPLTSEIEARELIVLNLRSQVLEAVPGLSPFPFETKILENRQERRYLESLFSGDELSGEDLRLTLIGLDGEVKQSWDGVIDPFLVFEAIDVMPMRQRELRQ